MLNKKTIMAALLALAVGAFTGCARDAEPAGVDLGEVSIATVTEADPQGAVDEIYANLPDARPEALTDYSLEDKLPGTGMLIEDYFGAISDPNGGLSDVIILDPLDGKREEVRDALIKYKDARMREFENYDILGAFEIARDALILDQGDYVILLMLPDHEAAQDTLDRYLPL